MKTLFKALIAFTLSFTVISCTENPRDKAMAYLNEARNAAEIGNDSVAKAYIDSIDINYPNEIAIRRQADTLMWQIDYRYLTGILPVIDSELDSINSIVPTLTKNFKFIKHEEYQDLGIFEHKLLRLENNAERCYLKVTVDEHGKPEIISNYTGAKKTHNEVKISVDSTSVESGIIPSENISVFSDGGIYKEMMIIDSETTKNILLFITQNQDNRVKVTLLGDNTRYYYYLTKNERTAIAQTCELAQTLSQLVKLVDAQVKTSQKIEHLKRKLSY